MAFDAAPLNEDLTINWSDNNLYSQMGAIGKECNLEWGGDWKFVDKPHMQYTFGLSIEDLLAGKRPPEQ
jgi:peptidoglycan L-alanyl-D-glutamate endopeptidase CwlK